MKKSKKTLLESKHCKICSRLVSFGEFAHIYKKLFNPNNKVEGFLNKLDKYKFSFFNSVISPKHYWKVKENSIYCPECLYQFYEAIHFNRSCFGCKRTISYIEALSSSYNKNVTKEDLLHYWFTPVIQFYCCSCFKKVMKNSVLI